MANEEHVKILKQGSDAWSKWRKKNPHVIPNLANADLKHLNLRGARLSGVNLTKANLRRANLSKADLSGAALYGAYLQEARLIGTNLSNARLKAAQLVHTDMTRAKLSKAKMHEARMCYTIFGETDLSEVEGLETVLHYGPSVIDIQTIYLSRGRIPEQFLRNAGVAESFITYMTSLTIEPIEFYSCFISYSSKDEQFAERLYSDLQNKGVRCWFAPEDLKIGEELRIGIDESIKVHDRLLLVLSKNSVNSQWVQQEVETALAKERQQGRTVLFPIRLDDTVMEISTGWPAFIRNTRNIGNFSNWKKL